MLSSVYINIYTIHNVYMFNINTCINAGNKIKAEHKNSNLNILFLLKDVLNDENLSEFNDNK